MMNQGTSTPIAVYKDDEGQVHKMSALCPHVKGIACWNRVEKSWDLSRPRLKLQQRRNLRDGPGKRRLAAIVKWFS
jgi:hypothetical protein